MIMILFSSVTTSSLTDLVSCDRIVTWTVCNNLNDLCELREGAGVLMTLSYDCEISKLII